MPELSAVQRIRVDGTPHLARVIYALQDAGLPITGGPRSFDVGCPCHQDDHPSCTVSDGDRGVKLYCHAGCDQDDLYRAAVEMTGLRQRDFFYRSAPRLAESPEPVTIARLAEAKRLPATELIAAGMYESPQGVRIPYWNEYRELYATRIRYGLVARDGSCWERGAEVSPYGAWRVPSYRPCRTLFVVEGESDCWTAWHYGLPAIGIPGKAHSRRAFANAPGLLRGFLEIVVVEEPDDRARGDLVRGVRRALTDADSSAEVFVMRLPVKDVSELHVQRPDTFIREFAAAHQKACDAASWDPPGPVPREAASVARWVQRTAKTTFTIRDIRDGSGLTWANVRLGIPALLAAGWVRELPLPRHRGRPSPRYRKSPLL